MMSLASSIVPMSRRKTVGPEPIRMGKFSRSFTLDTTESIGAKRSRSPVRIPGWDDGVPSVNCLDHFFRCHAISAQTVRVNTHHDSARRSSERRWRRDPRQSCKQRPNPVQGSILNFAHASSGAGENEVANWNAACIEAHDERRHGSRRHERASAVHIANCLSHGLAHVCARMKYQFQQSHVLNGFGFDGLNPRDVQEMIFVVVDEIPFHLRWRHPTKRLRYIDNRQVQIRKYINRHARDCENRAKGHTQDDNYNADRTSQRSSQQPHSYGPP